VPDVKALRSPVPVRHLVGTVIRLLFICLVAGLFMAFFGIRPSHLFNDFAESFWRAWDILAVVVRWAATYIALGAYVVVPVVLVVLLLRVLRR
jgi:hypothetical protein